MSQHVAETESLAAYHAVPLAAYGIAAGGQRHLLSQSARTGWRGLRAELREALAVLARPIETATVRLELTISRTPGPRTGAGDVLAAAYADFEDAPGLPACFARIANSNALALPEPDEATREQLAEALLRELEVQ
jgi:hypothetical protein